VQPEVSFLRRGDEEPAFAQEEIDYLSMTLSRAFAKASPDQWVVFALSIPSPASGSEMTTEAWYVEGTKLHILLPNFHAPVPMENLRQVLNRDPLFEVLDATRYEFVPIDYSILGSGKTSWLSVLREETPHLVIDYKKWLAAGSGLQKVQGAEANDEGVSPMNTDTSNRSSADLEDRLAKLKHFKEQDLITEEDYQRKKKALLDQL
jgi:hypothetical protein